MQLTIQEKKENSLLNRTEVKGGITFEGPTPSNAEIAAEVAKQIGANAEFVVNKNIYTKFGLQEATFEAVIYKDATARDKVERVTKHMKKKAEESQKKATEEAAAKKEEKEKAAEEAKKPAEEKTEEAPVEETKTEEPAEKVKEEKPTEEPAAEEKKEEGEQ